MRSSLPRFLAVGVLGMFTNLLIFFVLVDVLGWGATRSSILAFAVSVSQNYLLNHLFSFKEKVGDSITLSAYIGYLGVNLVGLVLNLAVMNGTLLILRVEPKVLAQVMGVGSATLLNYFGVRGLVFRKTRRGQSQR